MSNAKHTPGPWYSENGVIFNPTIGTVAVLCGDVAGKEANGNLIAAAPELLSVLENLARLQAGDQIGSSDVEAIRAAMIAAAGKENSDAGNLLKRG